MQKTKKELFTVIISHYNQKKYIYTAIDSVLNQNYERIEFIIYDDGSDFPKKNIQEYIEKKKGKNIETIKFIINEKNLGTVKTLNKTIKQATGEYLLFFAADDRLSDNSVITKMVNSFQANLNCDIISAQCMMYDNQLKKKIADYVDVKLALEMNEKTALEQYKLLCTRCLYSAGATAYRTKIFSETEYIEEEYQLVEDLSYWLKITRMGYKIRYEDFYALDHRDGGVSKSDHLKVLPPSVIMYYKDIIKINQIEILKYMNYFSYQEKCQLLDNYFNIIYAYGNYLPEMKNEIEKNIQKLYFKVPKYFILKFLKKVWRKMKYILKKFLIFIKKILRYGKKYFYLLIWFLLNWLMFSNTNIYESKVYFPIVMALNLFIAAFVIYIIKFIKKQLKIHKGGQ